MSFKDYINENTGSDKIDKKQLKKVGQAVEDAWSEVTNEGAMGRDSDFADELKEIFGDADEGFNIIEQYLTELDTQVIKAINKVFKHI